MSLTIIGQPKQRLHPQSVVSPLNLLDDELGATVTDEAKRRVSC